MIELGFSDDDAVAVASEKLEAIGTVAHEDHLIRVSVSDGPTAMLEIVRALDAAHLAPITMSLREPTLDDVFLELTGHAAEEPTEPDGEAPPEKKKSRRSRRSA